MTRLRLRPLALAVLVSSPAPAACDPSPLLLCGVIPDQGCPIGRGGTCEDATCAALYDCVEGSWTLVESCEGNGGGGVGGSGVGGGPIGGSGGCETATIDHGGEVEGCMPDLQSPDCPAVAAEICNPCLTDCLDFYLCKARGREKTWVPVAFCTEEGELAIDDGRLP